MPIDGIGVGGWAGISNGPSRCGQGGLGVTGILQINRAVALKRRPIFATKLSSAIFGLSGITKDATGAPLGNCVVNLFADGTEVWLQQTISDGSGFFSFRGIGVGSVFLTAYLDGAPEVAGITIHDLSPIVVG